MTIFYQQLIALAATPFYLFVIGLEWLVKSGGHGRSYNGKDTFHNFSMSLLAGIVDLLVRGVALALLSAAFSWRLAEWNHSLLSWAVLILLVDFCHYWMHRLGHSSRLFWAVHVVHHSSENFNLTVGFRAAVLEGLYRYLFFLPAVLVGFQPIDVIFIYSISEIWAVLTHTEMIRRLGWLEWFMVTPSHHRVHHASNVKYLDRNIGNTFIIWDKLFGTFQEELPAGKYEPIKYGLRHATTQNGLLNIILHEWKAIWHDLHQPGLSRRQQWMYIFGPPGWSHDGSRLTSRQLRYREALEEAPGIRSETGVDPTPAGTESGTRAA